MLRDFSNELVHFILDVFTFNQATKTSSKFKIIYKSSQKMCDLTQTYIAKQ